MKRLAAAAVICFAAATPVATGQDAPREGSNVHLLATGHPRAVRLAAQQIERGANYPSLIRLKGDVEIRTASIVVRADEATYDERTSEIEARGTVVIRPYPPAPDAVKK